jgi:hypothetical protein
LAARIDNWNRHVIEGYDTIAAKAMHAAHRERR